MYFESSGSVGAAALPAAVVAVSTIAAIAIAALLVLAIARPAIERTPPDRVPDTVDALARMLGQLAKYLPWSRQAARLWPPVPGDRADAAGDTSHPELPEEDA